MYHTYYNIELKKIKLVNQFHRYQPQRKSKGQKFSSYYNKSSYHLSIIAWYKKKKEKKDLIKAAFRVLQVLLIYGMIRKKTTYNYLIYFSRYLFNLATF